MPERDRGSIYPSIQIYNIILAFSVWQLRAWLGQDGWVNGGVECDLEEGRGQGNVRSGSNCMICRLLSTSATTTNNWSPVGRKSAAMTSRRPVDLPKRVIL